MSHRQYYPAINPGVVGLIPPPTPPGTYGFIWQDGAPWISQEGDRMITQASTLTKKKMEQ
jgi:hypothetical protein